MTNPTTTDETTFAEVVAVPTRAIANRDRKGRFQCAPLHIDFCRTKGNLHYDANGTTHSRRHCGDIVGRVRPSGSRVHGWLCATCIAVDGEDTTADDAKATKCGSAVCEGCDRRLRIIKFPTTLLTGVGQVRDFRVCRDCRRDGMSPTGELGVDPLDPVAMARAIATDWRPRRVHFRRVPDSSAAMAEHLVRMSA